MVRADAAGIAAAPRSREGRINSMAILSYSIGAGMKCSGAIAAAVLLIGATSAPSAAQPPAALDNPQIEIVYRPPTDRALVPIRDRLQRDGALERLKRFLAPLKLSQKLTVEFDQCGALARPYRPQGPATICYELVDRIERIAAKGAGS